MNLFTFLDEHAIDYLMTGSKVISPAAKHNDIDYAVLVKDTSKFGEMLKDKGWKTPSDDYKGNHFTSYRRGEYNLIVMSDTKLFACWKMATRLATQLQCETKEERIVVFNSIFETNDFHFKTVNKMENNKQYVGY